MSSPLHAVRQRLGLLRTTKLCCGAGPPLACASGSRTHAGRSSRYEGVVAPGSQLPDFMHTREPLLLNARGIEGRAAARARKADEVMVLDIMVASIPPARQVDRWVQRGKGRADDVPKIRILSTGNLTGGMCFIMAVPTRQLPQALCSLPARMQNRRPAAKTP